MDTLPAVTALSDESSDDEAPVAPKRGVKRQRLDEEIPLRARLGKRCWRKRKQCLYKFTGAAKFKELLSFRKDWCGAHKLDQDRIVTWVPRNRRFLVAEARGASGEPIVFSHISH